MSKAANCVDMSNAREHGGDWALLGFYYQMLAILGIGTLGSEKLATSDADTRLFLTTVTSDKDVTLISEEGGQDTTLLAGAHRILFQCKHSSNPVGSPVDMSEFRDVLKGFAYSLLLAEKSSGPPICGCILLTNRLPHDAIAEVKTIVQQCRDALAWQSSQISNVVQNTSAFAALPVHFKKQMRPFQGDITGLVDYWLSDKDVHGAITKRPEKKLLKAALRVLPTFYFLTEVHQSQYENIFAKFAEGYGATKEETEGAVTLMLGQLLQATGQLKRIALEDFVKSVTGQPNSRRLTPDGIGTWCASSWKSWGDERDARLGWFVDRPDIQNKITQAFLENKRIIFLVGSGGCGKTESLLEMTARKVNQFASVTDFPGFVAIKGCPEVKPDWLETAVGKWANRGYSPDQRLDMPIARLAIANPKLTLLLTLGLDGLDEEFPARETLDALVEATREREDLLLILTVRGSEYTDVSHFIHRNKPFPSFSRDIDPDIAVINVGEFNYGEVLNILASGVSPDLSNEVQQLVAGYDVNISSALVSISASYENKARTTSDLPYFIDSLKHPRMLGASVLAEQQSSGTLHNALLGDNDATNRIARIFIGHFLSKYKHRRKEKEMPLVHDYAALVKQVATITSNSSTALLETIWVDIVAQNMPSMSSKASQLFNEAASGGLIVIEDETASPREWEWKHSFVASYLASKPIMDFCPNE